MKDVFLRRLNALRKSKKSSIEMRNFDWGNSKTLSTLIGKVRNISEDTIRRGDNEQAAAYYRARVAISGELHGVKESFRLIPGMEAECEIKCGRRRVIEYVLYPFLKALDETAREP